MQELKETAEAVGFKQPRLGCWNKTNPVPINSKLNYLTNSKEFFATFNCKNNNWFQEAYGKAALAIYVRLDYWENPFLDEGTKAIWDALKEENEALEDYLDNKVFATAKSTTLR